MQYVQVRILRAAVGSLNDFQVSFLWMIKIMAYLYIL